jgi:PAS domain S-box-containing protein
MLRRTRDLPIRRKLTIIIVATSATALGLAGLASVAADYADSRAQFLRRHATLAKITADNSTAFLAFDDRRGAAATLGALNAEPSIVLAILYAPDGSEFARYQRGEGAEPVPDLPRLRAADQQLSGGYLHLREPVREAGRELGTLYMQADLAEVRSALLRDAGLLLAFTLTACLLAAALALRLQRSVSEPILQLAEVAEAVRRDRTWSLPAIPERTGEMLDELRQREAALRDSEANYRMLTEQASDGIAIVDRRGGILAVNQAACDLLGLTREEALQHRMQDLITSDDAASPPLEFETLRKGESVLAEHRFLHTDGSPIWIETNTKMLEDGRIQAILRDLTARKRLEDQLRQAQKMEAIGQLAGGVAHDFNNLLTVIGGFSEQLLSELPAGARHEELEEIRDAAARAADLTRQLLAFSRQQVLTPSVIELNENMEGLERMLTRIIGEDVRLTMDLEPSLGQARADPGQIEQVIVNLVVNARDAMPEGGRITLETRNVEVATSAEEMVREVPPGSYVVFSVRDTGHGIEPDHLSHVFEPFFTTKERGKGTGLGLSTLYGIVKQSGGYVTVRSTPGVETTFRVYLPRVLETRVGSGELELPRGLERGSECILLVEDDAMVRGFIRHVLERLGYTVLEAAEPAEALRLSTSWERPIGLLLTDVVMPGMSGGELARRLIAERPDIKVIFTTGYAGDALDRSRAGLEEFRILPKPFTPTALASLLREVLGGAVPR